MRIEAFLEMLSAERGARPNTLAAYERDLSAAESFTKARGRTLEHARAEDLAAYTAQMTRAGLSAATAARRLSALRQFFRFLLMENVRGDDPTAKIEGPKKRVVAQKTVVVPGKDALFVLQLNAVAPDGQQDVILDAAKLIDEQTKITP